VVVTSWLSSGWQMTDMKKLLANRLERRLNNVARSQMIQLPSDLALTLSSSDYFIMCRPLDLVVLHAGFQHLALLPQPPHPRTRPSSPAAATRSLIAANNVTSACKTTMVSMPRGFVPST
jgi:hypothetical protein